MKKPSFQQWLSESKLIFCDAYVKCTDGTEQFIYDCSFNYGISGRELISKMGYQIEDYFFVESVISASNYRAV